MAEQQQSFTPGEVPMASKPSFTVPGDVFYELTVVVGNHVYIGQGDRAVITISRSAGDILARGLIEQLIPSVAALSNGQQYEQDYTPGADKAREIVSWLESGETRNRVYRMVRDALNEPAPSKSSEIERAWIGLADRPCETGGLEDMEAGCCAPCRTRAALASAQAAK